MDPTKEFYQQVQQHEKEQQRQTSKEKWEKREQRFWKTFLFTEDGKPKSAFLIYTFCLSFVLLTLYVLSFGLLIDVLHPWMLYVPTAVGNFATSFLCSLAVLLPVWLIHHVSTDKRLVLGGYLWLGLYAIAILVTMAVLLHDDWNAVVRFLYFYAWLALEPVLIGLAGTFLLYKKSGKAQTNTPEPEWKKYVHRQ